MAGEEVFEERWEVDANSSRKIKIKGRYLRGNEMVTISVLSDSESFQLMLSGVSVIGEHSYEPLRFGVPAAPNTGELVGFVPAQKTTRVGTSRARLF